MNKMFIGQEEVPVLHVELVRDYSIPAKRVVEAHNSAAVLHAMLDRSPVEQFVSIYVGSDGNMTGAEKIAIGDLEQVHVSMRNLFRGALIAGVPRIILGHVHPTGDVTPSDPDLLLTAAAIQAGSVIGIEVIDHVIVTPRGSHFSIWDNQDEMLRRVDKLALKRMMDSMLGSHPLVDPLMTDRKPKATDIEMMLGELFRFGK